MKDSQAKNIIGVIRFSHNFTESFVYFNDKHRLDKSDNGLVQVHLSNSDIHRSLYIKQKIYELNEKFMSSLMRSCELSERLGISPFKIEASFGEWKFSFRKSLVSGVIVL